MLWLLLFVTSALAGSFGPPQIKKISAPAGEAECLIQTSSGGFAITRVQEGERQNTLKTWEITPDGKVTAHQSPLGPGWSCGFTAEDVCVCADWDTDEARIVLDVSPQGDFRWARLNDNEEPLVLHNNGPVWDYVYYNNDSEAFVYQTSIDRGTSWKTVWTMNEDEVEVSACVGDPTGGGVYVVIDEFLHWIDENGRARKGEPASHWGCAATPDGIVYDEDEFFSIGESELVGLGTDSNLLYARVARTGHEQQLKILEEKEILIGSGRWTLGTITPNGLAIYDERHQRLLYAYPHGGLGSAFVIETGETGTCPSGQSKSEYSMGHCCWPGQGWNGQACVGEATCPADLDLVSGVCQRPACPSETVRASDEEHCCWSGQDWSKAKGTCVGFPSCPLDYRPDNGECLPSPTCEAGMSLTLDLEHCCWPGQAWAGQCVGTPECPAGFSRSDSQCISDAEAYRKREAAKAHSATLKRGAEANRLIKELGTTTISEGGADIGCTPDQNTDCDQTPRRVTLESRTIMNTEVTRELYALVTRENATRNPNNGAGEMTTCAGSGTNLPMACIDWTQATRFANQLSELTGLEPAYSYGAKGSVSWDPLANGWRLPTESEWEAAARANTQDPYSGTAEREGLCEYANVFDASEAGREGNYRESFGCSDGHTGRAPVASFKPNAFGLYDMTGNVWEWTWDVYHQQPQGTKNPYTTAQGKTRVVRGGSFRSMKSATIETRHGMDDRLSTSEIGFRLVRGALIATQPDSRAEESGFLTLGPTDTWMLVDEHLIRATANLHLGATQHELQVWDARYGGSLQSVPIQDGENKSIKMDLQPRSGVIWVDAPSGTPIRVDGKLVSKSSETPLRLDLDMGVHEVQVGWEHPTWVEVNDGVPAQINEPNPRRTPPGTLSLAAGGVVLVSSGVAALPAHRDMQASLDGTAVLSAEDYQALQLRRAIGLGGVAAGGVCVAVGAKRLNQSLQVSVGVTPTSVVVGTSF